MKVNIVQKNDPVLRAIAKEVPKKDIDSPKIHKIIEDMKIALASQDDGVAIAAPQIGHSLRMFVVSGKVIGYIKDGDSEDDGTSKYPDQVFINPVITKSSREKETMEEGCLSVRYFYGKVRRSKKVTLVAYNENGEKIQRGVTGLMAQIFQHETDHLNGVLFTDTAEDLVDMPPEDFEHTSKKKNEK